MRTRRSFLYGAAYAPIALLLAFAAFVFFPVQGASAGSVHERALLADLTASAATLRVIDCRIRQEKYCAAPGIILQMHGRLYADREGMLLWELESPAPCGIRVTPEETAIWSEAAGVASRREFSGANPFSPLPRYLRPLLFFDEKALRSLYTLELVPDAPRSLRLVPQSFPLSGVVSELRIEYAENGSPAVIRITERSGDILAIYCTAFAAPEAASAPVRNDASEKSAPSVSQSNATALYSALLEDGRKGGLPLLIVSATPLSPQHENDEGTRVALLLENGFGLCDISLHTEKRPQLRSVLSPSLEPLCLWMGNALSMALPLAPQDDGTLLHSAEEAHTGIRYADKHSSQTLSITPCAPGSAALRRADR